MDPAQKVPKLFNIPNRRPGWIRARVESKLF
jgi:hypothetical protein